MCVFKCLLKSPAWEKAYWLHLFLSWSLCIIKCLFKTLVQEETKSHWLHLSDFSPVCVFKWVLKMPVCGDAYHRRLLQGSYELARSGQPSPESCAPPSYTSSSPAYSSLALHMVRFCSMWATTKSSTWTWAANIFTFTFNFVVFVLWKNFSGGMKWVFLGGGDVLFGGWRCAFLGGGNVSNLGGGDVLRWSELQPLYHNIIFDFQTK